jgi:Protein of unknown function (DUF3800)
MYVDESGDPGKNNSPTRYFVLSAIIFHESYWLNILDDLINFKRQLKDRYGLLIKEEIHASVFISGRPKLKNTIARNDRLDLLKKCLDWLSSRPDISIISVRIDKQQNTDPFDRAWQLLVQRFENTLLNKNFPGPFNNDKGLMFADNTNGQKLVKLVRQMRRYNPIPNMASYGGGSRNIPLRAIIEDPIFRDSGHSFLLQMVDVVAYFAKQVYEPNNFVKAKGARTFYGRLNPVINKHVTYSKKNYKIIEA